MNTRVNFGMGLLAVLAIFFITTADAGWVRNYTPAQTKPQQKVTSISYTYGTCGDGVVDHKLGEQCDDGNKNNNDKCTNNCRLNYISIHPECGTFLGDSPIFGVSRDSYYSQSGEMDIDPSELCEVGTPSPITYLDQFGYPTATWRCIAAGNDEPLICTNHMLSCGDSYITTVTGEECDDGNTIDGDGCDSSCHIEESASVCDDMILHHNNAPGTECLVYGYDYGFMAVDGNFNAYTGYQLTIYDNLLQSVTYDTNDHEGNPFIGINYVNINNIGANGEPWIWDTEFLMTVTTQAGDICDFRRCVINSD